MTDKIKAYILEDLKNIELTEAQRDACLRIEQQSLIEAWSPELFFTTMVEPRTSFFVLRDADNGQIFGFVCYSTVCDEAELLQICVDKSYRHQGLGKRLLIESLAELRKKGTMHFFLEVRCSNKIAISLYLSLGFNQDAVRRGYYRAMGSRPAENALMMSLHYEVDEV